MSLCLTMNSIPYAECDEGFEENPTVGTDSGGRRQLRCAWADRTALADYILTANSATVSGIDLQVGVAYSADYPSWFANSVRITPDDAGRNFAKLDVTYKPVAFDPLSPALIREERIGLSTEIVPLDLQNDDGSSTDSFAEGTLITYLTYKITLKNITTVPMAAVINCLNKTHTAAGTFTIRVGSSSTTVDGDQVLYQGIDDLQIGYTSGGGQRFDVTHNFLISPVGLNKVYNPAATDTYFFDRFVDAKPKRYDAADLSTLGV